MASDLKDTYVVHCADTFCSMGLRTSKIVLRESHGVYLKNMAQMTVKDQKGKTNVICFGGCLSPENPKTIEKAQEIAALIKKETKQNFSKHVEDIFMAEADDGSKLMQCAGECIPEIVSVEWDKEKEDVSVEPNKNALLGEATLTCKHGGIIRIITSGQPEL